MWCCSSRFVRSIAWIDSNGFEDLFKICLALNILTDAPSFPLTLGSRHLRNLRCWAGNRIQSISLDVPLIDHLNIYGNVLSIIVRFPRIILMMIGVKIPVRLLSKHVNWKAYQRELKD